MTVPGQPPSVNHGYRIVKQFRRDGRPFPTLAKTPEVVAYQMATILIVKSAKPKGWVAGSGQLRITVDLYLRHRADSDNLLKLLLDGVAKAIGVDDFVFLPSVRSKTIDTKNPRAEVTIERVEDDPGAPLLGQGGQG